MSKNTAPLILASKSASRQAMMKNAGLKFTAIPADIDERALDEKFAGEPQKLTKELARQKALSVARNNPDALVVGSDSVVALGEEIFNKAGNKQEALEKLMALSGKTHQLISAVAVASSGVILWDRVQIAELTMRKFDENFARLYIEKLGQAALDCVGAYQLEALGPWLFEKIEGDYFTILGMPLLPLLNYLQDYHDMTLEAPR